MKKKAAFFTGEDVNGKLIQRVSSADQYPLQKESKQILKTDLFNLYTENYKVDIPVFVIGSYADLYFKEESLKATATAYADNEKTALKILKGLCHDMMLDDYIDNDSSDNEKGWEKAAKYVLEFVEDPVAFVDNPNYHWSEKN